MTKDEAIKLALEALKLNNDEWKALADSGDAGNWAAEDQDHYKQTNEAIAAIEALAEQPARPDKLKVTLEDRPIDIELAQYKRMFEAACFALAQIGDALGCDPEEGGVAPILFAIAELKSEQPAQRTWVGLSDEEREIASWADGSFGAGARWAEAKLKDKNNG